MPRGKAFRSKRPTDRRDSPRKQTPPEDGGQKKNKFSKQGKMSTFKSIVDTYRQTTASAKEDTYLGCPPPDRDYIEASLVLPGKHLLPLGLGDPSSLNAIRKSLKVWITRTEPNVLLIQAETISRLQEAWQAVNWAIHDMRVSNEHQSTRVIVQQPIKVSPDAVLTLVAGERAQVSGSQPAPDGTYSSLEFSLSQLRSDAAPTFEVVMAVEKHLRMRVNFGRVIAYRKKKTPTPEVSYEDLISMAAVWSRRGGAALETRLPHPSLANKSVDFLTNPENGLCESPDVVDTTCTLSLVLEDCLVEASIMMVPHGDPQISTASMMKREHYPRLNWTVAAPDMRFDWNLRVDGMEIIEKVPEKFQLLLRTIGLKNAEDGAESQGLLKFPRLYIRGQLPDSPRVLSTSLRMSTVIPYKDTPFALEISTMRAWRGMDVLEKPGADCWSVEFYGMHWEEAINYIPPGEVRKDWGQDLKFVWVGAEPSLNMRYEKFLRTVLEVQEVLNRVDSGSEKQ